VAVTFIGGGNQSTQRKPPTCLESLTLSHNVVSKDLNNNIFSEKNCLDVTVFDQQ
jgi:hypothetical protein